MISFSGKKYVDIVIVQSFALRCFVFFRVLFDLNSFRSQYVSDAEESSLYFIVVLGPLCREFFFVDGFSEKRRLQKSLE